jgi:deoxyribose-phosphate aldolase
MQQLSRVIDHTLLKSEATLSQIAKLCEEAQQHFFYAVCVNSRWVPECVRRLKTDQPEKKIHVCAVVGFPLGAMATEMKAAETAWCVQQGADEIDMVISIGDLKDKNNQLVQQDIASVVQAAQGKVVKVILETHLLTEQEKIQACLLAKQAGAHFVKTSTGFTGGGATLDDVRLMKNTVGDSMQVKASGGVRDTSTALKMLEAGATRLGTSSGVSLVLGQKSQGGY